MTISFSAKEVLRDEKQSHPTPCLFFRSIKEAFHRVLKQRKQKKKKKLNLAKVTDWSTTY